MNRTKIVSLPYKRDLAATLQVKTKQKACIKKQSLDELEVCIAVNPALNLALDRASRIIDQ
jgi:hypothetical protein